MIDFWYLVFVACVLILLAFSTQRDRNALRIILAASVVGCLLVIFVTRQIHAPWKLAIPGALEAMTAVAMYQWSKNITGHLQIGCLFVAWLTHALCYLDLWFNTDLVYSHYETIIQVVALAQLAACYDTILHAPATLRDWAKGLRRIGVRGVPDARVGANLLTGPDFPSEQNHP